MKRMCLIVMVLLLWTVRVNCEDKPVDVGIVLEISGEWFLQSTTSTTQVKLHKGYALPAGGTISTGSNSGKLVIHIYEKTQPDTYRNPPSSTIVLPTSLDKFPSFPERFWRIFRRLFGSHPDDFTVTISQIPTNAIFVGTASPPSYFAADGIYYDNNRLNFFSAGTFGFYDTFQTGDLYALRPVSFGSSDIFSLSWSSTSLVVSQEPYLWNPNTVYHTQPNTQVPWGGNLELQWNFVDALPSRDELKETVLEMNDGWVDIGPLLGNGTIENNTLAFRRIVQPDQPETRQYPDILFTWPPNSSQASTGQTDKRRYEVPLPPGLYRVSYFNLSLNQPEGSDAWVLIEQPEAYKKSRKFFDDLSQQVDNWPKDIDQTLRRTFVRVCLQYLLEPGE